MRRGVPPPYFSALQPIPEINGPSHSRKHLGFWQMNKVCLGVLHLCLFLVPIIFKENSVIAIDRVWQRRKSWVIKEQIFAPFFVTLSDI